MNHRDQAWPDPLRLDEIGGIGELCGLFCQNGERFSETCRVMGVLHLVEGLL
jgi:hypothetical protein